jgi:type II secretory pathway pseudopilin PulG
MLIAVVVMVALVLIALSVAAPVIAKDLRRDKEVESQHRAEQYVRAIRLYYRKTHHYPPSIDALKNTNNIRFLRQEYVDPLTGKADWKLIHMGEQKTTVKGFFGQELGGLPGAGAGGGGLGSAAGMSSGIGTPVGSSGTSNTSTIGATSPLASGFQGASTTTTTPGTAGLTGSSGATGSSAFSAGGLGGAFGSTGSSGSLGGGGVIIGVDTAKTGDSITTPNQQTTYETWEFWYDPRIEQLYQKGITNMGISSGSLGSTPASSFGTGLNGQPNSPTGSPLSTSPFSNTPTSPATGTSPTPTTPPTPPPQ